MISPRSWRKFPSFKDETEVGYQNLTQQNKLTEVSKEQDVRIREAQSSLSSCIGSSWAFWIASILSDLTLAVDHALEILASSSWSSNSTVSSWKTITSVLTIAVSSASSATKSWRSKKPEQIHQVFVEDC